MTKWIHIQIYNWSVIYTWEAYVWTTAELTSVLGTLQRLIAG